MCGIFGYVGSKNSLNQCLQGLKFLEYRGYDSSGIAGSEQGNLVCYKKKGKLSELEGLLANKLHQFEASIGHTRWATHGEATTLNAHPHLDQENSVAIVHNGIIENHQSLRKFLQEKGVTFQTDTDSEVIAQLIAYLYEGDLSVAMQKASELMEGFWAIAAIHKLHPQEIVATRKENPIIIGVCETTKEAYLSSDLHSLNQQGLKLHFLENGQIAKISCGKVKLLDKLGQAISFSSKEISLPPLDLDKGEFPHFMLKEIYEQPLAVTNAIHGRIPKNTQLGADIAFESQMVNDLLKGPIDQVLILGCGTSYHAGLIAAMQIEQLAQVPARAVIASEYRYSHLPIKPNTLVLALSQSGETFDTIGAVRLAKKHKAKVLSLCNVVGSSLTRLSDASILLRAGPEISVCSTKAFICQLTVLSLIAYQIARSKTTKETAIKLLDQIASLPSVIEQVFAKTGQIEALAKKYASYSHFFFLGRQYMFPTSLEAALKLKEISYLFAEGYPAGELKHGPIALIDETTPVIGLLGNDATFDKMLSNLSEIKARKGPLVVLAPQGAHQVEQIADDVIYLPKVADPFSPIPYTVTLQLLAYFIASQRGTDIDQPRNLAKSVTVE